MKYLMLIVLLFPVTVFGQAMQADFTWNGTTDPDRFVLWERTVDGKVMVGEATGSSRTLQFEAVLAPECSTYFLTAEENGIHTLPSDGYPMCPKPQLPDRQTRPDGTIDLDISKINSINITP